MLKRLWVWFKQDTVMALALTLALVSCFFIPFDPEVIDLKVLAILLCLMLVIKAFEELHLLEIIAVRLINASVNKRMLDLVLVALCFFLAMLVTNDIALITFIPLSLVIAMKLKTDMLDVIVLQTMAANLGSSLTPMGNPQNLYLFSRYAFAPLDFIATTGFLVLSGGILLVLALSRLPSYSLSIRFEIPYTVTWSKTGIWLTLFGLTLTSVFGWVPYPISLAVTLIVTAILDRSYFRKVDLSLLITFIGFFVFVGNLAQLAEVRNLMQSLLADARSTLLTSILSSQILSNVPSALLLSGFTVQAKALLLGVNIGGLGTLIASLASVITYKFYARAYPGDKGRFLKRFTVYNGIGLVLLTSVFWFMIK